jgi:hypothetical protein
VCRKLSGGRRSLTRSRSATRGGGKAQEAVGVSRGGSRSGQLGASSKTAVGPHNGVAVRDCVTVADERGM